MLVCAYMFTQTSTCMWVCAHLHKHSWYACMQRQWNPIKSCESTTLFSAAMHLQQPLTDPLTRPSPRPTRHLQSSSQKAKFTSLASPQISQLPAPRVRLSARPSRVWEKKSKKYDICHQREITSGLLHSLASSWSMSEETPFHTNVNRAFSSSPFLSLLVMQTLQIWTTTLCHPSKLSFMRMRTEPARSLICWLDDILDLDRNAFE